MEERNFNSDRAGDYDSRLDYIYNDYGLDTKIPIAKYIFMYIVMIVAAVVLFSFAKERVPKRGKIPYEEPVVIDRLGCFENIEAVTARLSKLENKVGYPVYLVTVPYDEYEVQVSSYEYHLYDLYHFYTKDENHILIHITYAKDHYIAGYSSGNNVDNAFGDPKVIDLIADKFFYEGTSNGILIGLDEVISKVPVWEESIYVYFIGGALLIIGVVVHFFIFILKKLKKQKECHDV